MPRDWESFSKIGDKICERRVFVMANLFDYQFL